MVSWWLNIMGILLSTIGTISMFCGTPRDSRFTDRQVDIITAQKNTLREEAAFNKRKKLSKWGIRLLLLGFFVQLIAQISQYP